VAQLERLFHTHAPMAKEPFITVKQGLIRRIMKVYAERTVKI
jgi:hypothetical protein